MTPQDGTSIQTRPSLLSRLRAGDDTASWREFYRVYGKLTRDFAIRAGLTDAEADEAVQETAIAVARHLSEFHYDRSVCRFKTWLLNQASWRIKDQFKKRARAGQAYRPPEPGAVPREQAETTRISPIERVVDPGALDLDAMFETEWRKNLLVEALERVRERVKPKQFQIFDLYVLKEWAASAVANSLGVSLATVYVTKHRIASAVQKEIKRLERPES